LGPLFDFQIDYVDSGESAGESGIRGFAEIFGQFYSGDAGNLAKLRQTFDHAE